MFIVYNKIISHYIFPRYFDSFTVSQLPYYTYMYIFIVSFHRWEKTLGPQEMLNALYFPRLNAISMYAQAAFSLIQPKQKGLFYSFQMYRRGQ